MIHLLIVDDEHHAVEGIRQAMDWNKLGVGTVLTAGSMQEAMAVFGQFPVDIMICDIEMPAGTGLELLAWVKEHHAGTETIFLTCHAEFRYAKQAVQLGSYDYILKPVPIPELTQAVAGAIRKKGRQAQMEQYSEFGQYWIKHQPVIVEKFWTDVLSRSIPPTTEAIIRAAGERHIPFHPQMKFLPLLISVRRWHKKLDARDEKIMEYALRNAAEEALFRKGTYGQLIPWKDGALVAILSFGSGGDPIGQLEEAGRTFIDFCHDRFFCDISCYAGRMVHAHTLAEAVQELAEMDKNNIAYDNRLLTVDRQTQGLVPPVPKPPDLVLWTKLLEEKEKEALVREVTDYCKSCSLLFDAKKLNVFHQDLVQLLYHYLQVRGIHASQLFGDPDSMELAAQAGRSVARLLEWFSLTVGRALSYVQEIRESLTVLERVSRYMELHLDEPLTRNDIAKSVFLNPDYLDRLLKKECGSSTTELMYKKRIEAAGELLLRTDISISSIAVTVGYRNFSHFSRSFKKHTGISPMEYRLRGDSR